MNEDKVLQKRHIRLLNGSYARVRINYKMLRSRLFCIQKET